MNRLFLLICLITAKFASAGTGTISIPTQNLGNYNKTSGNSVVATFQAYSGGIQNELNLGGGALTDYSIVLSNGTSSITATASSYYSSYIYWIPACTNIYKYAMSGAGNSTFCTTISVPSGATLTPGVYTG